MNINDMATKKIIKIYLAVFVTACENRFIEILKWSDCLQTNLRTTMNIKDVTQKKIIKIYLAVIAQNANNLFQALNLLHMVCLKIV